MERKSTSRLPGFRRKTKKPRLGDSETGDPL